MNGALPSILRNCFETHMQYILNGRHSSSTNGAVLFSTKKYPQNSSRDISNRCHSSNGNGGPRSSSTDTSTMQITKAASILDVSRPHKKEENATSHENASRQVIGEVFTGSTDNSLSKDHDIVQNNVEGERSGGFSIEVFRGSSYI